MTAEIAVMNKQAVALAADSAVTVGGNGEKIYASANKIFALSKVNPVGVMIYGSAEVLGLPWELVIKRYRRQLGNREFDSLEEYEADFLSFLGESQELFPPDRQRDFVVAEVTNHFIDEVRSPALTSLEAVLKKNGDAGESEISEIFTTAIGQALDRWSDAEPTHLASYDREHHLMETYQAQIVYAMTQVFENVPLDDEDNARLLQLAVLFLARTPPDPNRLESEGVSGLVFAGFGTRDVFPKLRNVDVRGIANNEVICWLYRHAEIDFSNTAYVGAFAQGEMVGRFMEGIDPDYQDVIERSIQDILEGYSKAVFDHIGKSKVSATSRRAITDARGKLVEKYLEELGNHRQAVYVQNVIQAVESLPIDELADMAESLVNLTSLKRKVSMEAESVGGPIDVAVISSGDGLVWIKRKHYFEPDRNPHFFRNYDRELKGR